jgi:hypothetical protein
MENPQIFENGKPVKIKKVKEAKNITNILNNNNGNNNYILNKEQEALLNSLLEVDYKRLENKRLNYIKKITHSI